MKREKEVKKLRVLKLSKDNQKRILGGTSKGTYCDPSDTCVGAMHRVVNNHYKNG